MEGETGYGRKRAVQTLNKENWRLWFSQQRNNLRGKGVFWVISDLQTIRAREETPSATPELSSTDASLQHEGLSHSMHSTKWIEADGKAMYEIIQCLSSDDQDEVIDEQKAYDVWTKLYKKYSTALPAHAIAIVSELVNYRMEEEDTIRKA